MKGIKRYQLPAIESVSHRDEKYSVGNTVKTTAFQHYMVTDGNHTPGNVQNYWFTKLYT